MTNSAGRLRSTLAAAALLLSLLGSHALGQDDGDADPVVLEAGEYVETRSEIDQRFEIAVRALAANRGLELDESMRAELEELKPGYLEQRATEVALLLEADRRGIEVSEEEVDAQLEQVRGTLAEGEELADLLERAGFSGEEQLRRYIAETERIQRTIDALEQELEVTPGEVTAFYEENAELFAVPEQVCARHILVEEADLAEELLAELEEGAEFAALAAEHSIDPGGSGGGDLGCFPRGRMVAPFEEAAFAAPVGEPVGPVESQFGHHLILVYERQEAGTAPLESVEERIAQQLRREELGEAVESLRRAADIELYPERLAAADAAPAAEEGAEPAEEGEAEQEQSEEGAD